MAEKLKPTKNNNSGNLSKAISTILKTYPTNTNPSNKEKNIQNSPKTNNNNFNNNNQNMK